MPYSLTYGKKEKKKPSLNSKKLGSTLKDVSEKLTPIGKLALAHPVVVGLALMTGCQLGKMGILAVLPSDKIVRYTSSTITGTTEGYKPYKDTKPDALFQELQGLYYGVQAITGAAIAVPLVAAGLNVAGGLLSGKQ